MVFKEINKDSNLYCNSCFSRVAKVTVRFGTVNNAIAVRLCGECYGKLSSPQQEELEAQTEKIQEKLKTGLIADLKEQIQYSTSPSCTKGMELFIKSIERWEVKEND